MNDNYSLFPLRFILFSFKVPGQCETQPIGASIRLCRRQKELRIKYSHSCIIFTPVGVANSNLKHLPTPDAPVWFPTKGHHQPTVDYLKSVSSFKAAYLMIRKLRKEKYIQRAYGNMPLVEDQAAAFTGVAVGLRMIGGTPTAAEMNYAW